MKSEHTFFKPLTLKSNQHLFFPYNITPESLIRVMRVKKMITKLTSL